MEKCYSFLLFNQCYYLHFRQKKWPKLCSLFICLILFCSQSKAQQSGYQLVYQETFEAPLAAPWTSSSTSWDATESVSPTHSLNYTRTNTTAGPLLGPSVSFTPGQSCYASVMMKTANLSAGTQGARIMIEAYNGGSWISGAYSSYFRGTTWTEVVVPNYTIPPTATTVKVYIYLQGGYTGTVWFDDFKFFAVPTKPLASKMVSPSYRGLLMDNEYSQIELSTKLLTSPANYYSRVKLLDANNQVIATQTGAAGQTPFTAIFPATGLASGTYKVLAEAVDNATQQAADSNVYTIKKLGAADAKPQNYVDKYGRLIVNGQPYFTLGAYYGGLSDAVINDTKNSPLNTVISYQFTRSIGSNTAVGVLDKLNAAGLKTLFSLQDFYSGTDQQQADSITKYVNLLKNHPAILGWYSNDETNIGNHGPQMLKHQTLIESLDYNHPSYGVDLTLPTGEFTTKANDMFGTDFYPVHNDASSVSNPGAWTKFVKTELPHRAPITVIQSFSWGGAGDRFPTVPEMRSMSWQSIAEGATGLMYYAYFEVATNANYPVLWANLKQVTQEIKAMAPAILSVEQVPNVTITGSGTWMNWTVRKYNNRVYVIAANNQKTAYQGVTFNVPNAATVKVLNENRTLPVSGGSFTDAFGSLDVHVYEVSLNTGNVNPTVSITSPVNNANIKDPATINITANAADAGGSVTKVEFFQGETKLGEDLTAPYSFSWTNMTTGDYALTAKVWDNSGIFTVSDTVKLTVSPVVNGVISPIADAYVRDGSANINTNFGTAATLVVKNDNSGGLMRETYLKFDLNGQSNFEKATLRLNVATAGTNTQSTQWKVYYVPSDSWTETGITWSNKPAVGALLATINGLRSGWAEWDISAQALAELGADKTLSLKIVSTLNSNTADVSFNSKEASNTALIPQLLLTSAAKAPVVSITSPVAGASFNAPASIAITANATDADGTITKVEFFEGANKLGEATAAPYTFNWNNVAAGTYNLSAKATDNDGVVSTSAVTNITVSIVLGLANNEVASESTVKLYPNPVQDNFRVSVISKVDPNATISIYNMLGVRIRQLPFTAVPQNVFAGDLSSGIYIVVVQNGHKTLRSTIIKN